MWTDRCADNGIVGFAGTVFLGRAGLMLALSLQPRLGTLELTYDSVV